VIEILANVEYKSFAWLLDMNGSPVTGASANLSCKVLDESNNVHASPAPAEVDAVNTPGLYSAAFTPDNVGLFKVHWKSLSTTALVTGGEVVKVLGFIEENDSFVYPDSDVTEIDVTEEFTTPWSGFYDNTRHHRATYFNMDAVQKDGIGPHITIREYFSLNGGVDWILLSVSTINHDSVERGWSPTARYIGVDYKITMQSDAGLLADRAVPYYYNVVIDN
jgi:hypothetical protein